MTDVPHPFAPFSPSPPLVPEQPKAEKAPRKPRAAKAEAAPVVEVVPAVEKPARKARGPNKAKAGLKAHSPKFDLQTTLAAAQLLNESDFPMFEKMVVMLDEAGKPQRDRVMSALAKVFA